VVIDNLMVLVIDSCVIYWCCCYYKGYIIRFCNSEQDIYVILLQIQLLREQLNQEVKRRQLYVLRSSRTGREMQQLRQALGDSLRTVSQDPSLDALLLEHEARKLDTTLASATSLPPTTTIALPLPAPHHSYSVSSPHDVVRSTPQSKWSALFVQYQQKVDCDMI